LQRTLTVMNTLLIMTAVVQTLRPTTHTQTTEQNYASFSHDN